MTKKVYFITTNPGKFATAHDQLASTGIELIQKPIELIEPQADTVQEVAIAKAQQAKTIVEDGAVIVLDSGLVIPGLKGFPGVYTKYCNDTIKSEGILALIDKICPDERYAYFEQAIAYLEDGEISKVFSERYEGEIVKEIPSDTVARVRWSDFHRIFTPKGCQKTLCQMDLEEEKQAGSQAVSQPSAWKSLSDFLAKNISGMEM